MTNEKMVIQTQGDRLLLGAHFHELADMSAYTFRTAEIASFVKSLEGAKDFKILIDNDQLSAEPLERDRYTRPIAVCALAETEAMQAMRSLHGKPRELQDMVAFLEKYKRYGHAGTVEFLSSLRHFKMKKVIGVEVQQERNGNYHCAVSLENAGRDDFEPPSVLKFQVPVFRHLLDQEDSIDLSFELNFEVAQANPPKLHFVLVNFSLDEEVLGKKKAILARHLSAITQDKLWGNLNFSQQDDAWRFLTNPHPEGEAAKTALMLSDNRRK